MGDSIGSVCEVMSTEHTHARRIMGACLHVSVSKGDVPKVLPTELATQGRIQFTSGFMTPLVLYVLETDVAELTPPNLSIALANPCVTLALQSCFEERAAMLTLPLGAKRLVALKLALRYVL